jgi:hypothetical protein
MSVGRRRQSSCLGIRAEGQAFDLHHRKCLFPQNFSWYVSLKPNFGSSCPQKLSGQRPTIPKFQSVAASGDAHQTNQT